MAKPDTRGRERFEIKLHVKVIKKLKAKAEKAIPPVSPKKYVEDLVHSNLNQTP